MEKNISLEEMRSQMAVLKEKVNSQKLLNERLMRSAMQSKIQVFVRDKIQGTVSAAVMGPLLCLYILPELTTVSLAFIIYTAFIFILSFVFTFYNYTGISVEHITTDSLAEVCHSLVKMKKRNARRVALLVPCIVLWFVWFFVEDGYGNSSNSTFAGICGIVCGVAGAVIGFIMYRKRTNMIEKMIAEIEEMERM